MQANKAGVFAKRYHDISCGHRVYGHESKCAHLHGHNYRFHFTVQQEGEPLDNIGRVLDFSVIKSELCMWLEYNWDHKFILWAADPLAKVLPAVDPEGIVVVNFNPTAENMAIHMVEVVGPALLEKHHCVLTEVIVEETRKCSASYIKGERHDQ